jgi:hypothetical protein
MAQSANHVKLSENPENLGWDLFEVGSHEEVIRLSEKNPNSPFLNQLALLARLEEKNKISESTPMGITILSPMVEAYLYFQKKKYKEAANHLDLYYKNPNSLICYHFTKLSISVYYSEKNFISGLKVIDIYKKKTKDKSFLNEEITGLYELKKYELVVSEYQKNSSELNSTDSMRILGMSLLFLGKHKEAEKILKNISGNLNLPSFEEKCKEYSSIIQELPNIEKRSDTLNKKELEDLGFAYLFNGNYEKAETTFLKLISGLKMQSYRA